MRAATCASSPSSARRGSTCRPRKSPSFGPTVLASSAATSICDVTKRLLRERSRRRPSYRDEHHHALVHVVGADQTARLVVEEAADGARGEPERGRGQIQVLQQR